MPGQDSRFPGEPPASSPAGNEAHKGEKRKDEEEKRTKERRGVTREEGKQSLKRGDLRRGHTGLRNQQGGARLGAGGSGERAPPLGQKEQREERP